jgi:hypothetical protein
MVAVQTRNPYQSVRLPVRADPGEIRLAYRGRIVMVDRNPDAGPLQLSTDAPRLKSQISIPDDFLSLTPSLEELRDHVAQNFLGCRLKSGGPLRRLGFEAFLQSEDVRLGCYLPMILFEDLPRVLFQVPPETHSGQQFEVDLNGTGIRNLILQPRIVIV